MLFLSNLTSISTAFSKKENGCNQKNIAIFVIHQITDILLSVLINLSVC